MCRGEGRRGSERMDRQAGREPGAEPRSETEPGTDWTRGAVVVAFDRAGHAAFWPAGPGLPAGWTRAHGPCAIAAARSWVADPANAREPSRGPESALAPDPAPD